VKVTGAPGFTVTIEANIKVGDGTNAATLTVDGGNDGMGLATNGHLSVSAKSKLVLKSGSITKFAANSNKLDNSGEIRLDCNGTFQCQPKINTTGSGSFNSVNGTLRTSSLEVGQGGTAIVWVDTQIQWDGSTGGLILFDAGSTLSLVTAGSTSGTVFSGTVEDDGMMNLYNYEVSKPASDSDPIVLNFSSTAISDTVTVNGDFSQASGGQTTYQMVGTGASQVYSTLLNVQGNVAFHGNLTISTIGTIAYGTVVNLVHANSITPWSTYNFFACGSCRLAKSQRTSMSRICDSSGTVQGPGRLETLPPTSSAGGCFLPGGTTMWLRRNLVTICSVSLWSIHLLDTGVFIGG
jgi:hypothetical protein